VNPGSNGQTGRLLLMAACLLLVGGNIMKERWVDCILPLFGGFMMWLMLHDEAVE
jgi:zinc transporter ZupT